LKFGLYIPNYGKIAFARTLGKLAVDAEKSGWDGFFLWDSISGEDKGLPTVDAVTALAAIAAVTRRIRLGTIVMPLARRRPWKVARETATLDHLSNGRLTLGVGLGYPSDQEFARFAEDPDDKVRAAKLDEALEILAGLWSGKPFSYNGSYFAVKHTRFHPPSKQRPRIPVWVGGLWPNRAPFRRAARWDGVVPLKTAPGIKQVQPADLREILAYVRRHRADARKFDVAVIGWTAGSNQAKDRAKIETFAKAGATWWLESLYTSRNSPEKMRRRIRKGPPR
jgi:alkanesulfonate monooxygenase SsuD/methylene tetrahydromethanopterin reductase-like flavin-dependent oxidoreductase (luciferase family)